jgi:hypothetical protein
MIRLLDRFNLVLIVAALMLMVQPWWSGGLRTGFFVMMVAIVGQNIFPRLRKTD